MKLWLQRNYPVILFVVLSVLIAGFAYASPGPVVARVAVSVFAVIFVSAIGHMIWSAVDRKLIGKTTLRVPTEVNGGATFRAQMRVENAALAGRLVTFLTKCERFDDDDNHWKEKWTSRAVSLLARGTLSADVTLEIPRDALVTKEGAIRWDVTATIDGFQRAEFSQPIFVRPASAGFAAADELLDQPRLENLEFESPLKPEIGVFDVAGKQWCMREKSISLRVVGVFFLGFATLWLWLSTRGLRGDSFASFDPQSIAAWGELLFHAPFLLVGLGVALIGAALLTFQSRFGISATEISEEMSVFGWFKRGAVVVPREVLAIRVIESREAGNRLQLGVMTARGVLALPIGVSRDEALAEPHKLKRYARWLTETINRRDIAFDATPHSGLQAIRVPKLFGKPETNALADANPAAAQARFKAFQAIGGGLAILTFAGFVMMIAGGMFGDRSARAERRSAKAVKVDAETRVRIENAIRSLPAPTDVKNGGACPFEDKSYCGTLILATRQNDVEQVKKLLAAGANPHERDANGWSPWAYALSRSNAATINAFIDIEVPVRGAQDLPFNGTQRQSVPPLVFALGHGNAGAVQTLIKRGADPNERGPYGYPAANFAAYYGNVAALKALKESGIDLLTATPPGLPHDGETFLMHAAEGGKPEAVDYLLSLGANASDRDPRGKNAGDHAKAYGHAALAEKLWAREKK